MTKRVVDAARPSEDRYIVWDSDLKGFGLRVEPSGIKTYIVRYRIGGGRDAVRRQLVLGRHGVLTAEEARDLARVSLADAVRGSDPQTRRSGAQRGPDMAELCDLYQREGCATKKASTNYIDGFRINGLIKPALGKIKVSALTAVMRGDMLPDNAFCDAGHADNTLAVKACERLRQSLSSPGSDAQRARVQ